MRVSISRSIPLMILTAWFFVVTSVTAQEGYYKDILMDGGIGLTPSKTLPVADYLELSIEYVSLPYKDVDERHQAYQDEVFLGSDIDSNGRLLYPDGAPRFRCVHVRGGSSFTHGKSLGENGRGRFLKFVKEGGSYVGTCAGFSLSSVCRSDFKPGPYRDYLKLWPAMCHYSGIAGSGNYLDHKIPDGSPLLKYYDYGGDRAISHLRHNMGSYAIEDDEEYWCDKTEVLMYHDFPGHEIDGKVSCLAYRESDQTGRLTLIGSHPEAETEGEQLDLMAALVRYALDGNGAPKVKAELHRANRRRMHDNDALGFEKLGDLQYHHFIVNVPAQATDLEVWLENASEYPIELYARHGGFAFRGESEIVHAVTENGRHVVRIASPKPGNWFIGVKGASTVETKVDEFGHQYVGNLELLNGLAYSITADWSVPKPNSPPDLADRRDQQDFDKQSATEDLEAIEIDRSFRVDFTPRRIQLMKEYAEFHYGEYYRRSTGAPKFPGVEIEPKVICVHYTAGKTLQNAFDTFAPETLGGRPYLNDAGAINVGVQFVVDRDGKIYEIQPDNYFGRHVIGLNHCAIGIENVGIGDVPNSVLNSTEAQGKQGSGHRLTLAQVEANEALIRYLKRKYSGIEILIGHSEYRDLEDPKHPGSKYFFESDAKYRTVKSDPGPNFMKALRGRLVDVLQPDHRGQVFRMDETSE